jgi:hypothetical protein
VALHPGFQNSHWWMYLFVSKEEEKALKFEEEVTDFYRKEHDI